MTNNNRPHSEFSKDFHDSLETVRRNVNLLQMELDNYHKIEIFDLKHEVLVNRANSSLEEAIMSLHSSKVEREFSTRESIDKWIMGETQLICDMMTCQLKSEIEETGEGAVEKLRYLMRLNIDLKPYQKEMIMRIQQRHMRRRYYYKTDSL